MDTRTDAFVVLGMHRSGTSALTRVMNLLGARLPNDLLAPGENNILGYWESRQIVSSNDRLLGLLDRFWADPKPMPVDWMESRHAISAIEAAKELIQKEFGGNGGFVLKDPRFSRLMPVWQIAMSHFGIEPLCLIACRNPLEVFHSLNARNGFDAEHVFLLWLAYTLEAEFATREMRRVVIHYDALIDDWRSTLSRGLDDIGAGGLERSRDSMTAADSFIDQDQHHHRSTLDQFLDHPEASSEVKDAYTALRSGDALEDPDIFDRLRQRWRATWEKTSPGLAASSFATSLPEVQLQRSMTLLSLGQIDEAIEAARMAIDLDHEKSRMHHHLGNLFARAERWDEAESALRGAIALDRDIPAFHNGLSHVLARLDRVDEAIEAAQTAVELDPGNSRTRHHLGNLLARAARLGEA